MLQVHSQSNKKPVLIFCGPTSSGKTSVALSLASLFNFGILSADSRQVCKYMDIGTGKIPTDNSSINISKSSGIWNFDDVSIWGYDLVNPHESFSAFDFKMYARTKLDEFVIENKLPVIVGGTGFYIDATTGAVDFNRPLPSESLRQQLAVLSLEEMLSKLVSLAPETLTTLDIKNKRRVQRQLESVLSTDTNTSNSFQEKIESNYNFCSIYFDIPRDILFARADNWVEAIWQLGLIAEIEKLISLGFESSYRMHGLIYKTGLRFIHSEISKNEAIQIMKYELHAYIRRQQTWFKAKKHNLILKELDTNLLSDFIQKEVLQ